MTRDVTAKLSSASGILQPVNSYPPPPPRTLPGVTCDEHIMSIYNCYILASYVENGYTFFLPFPHDIEKAFSHQILPFPQVRQKAFSHQILPFPQDI